MTERQKLILKIMHLAYLVHEYTDYCVFIRFSGHVDDLAIDIRQSKKEWRVEAIKSEMETAYSKLKGNNSMYLYAKIQVLEDILVYDEIDYEEMDYEEECIRHYTF